MDRSKLRHICSGSSEDERSLDVVGGTVGKFAVKVLTLESALDDMTRKALGLEKDLLSRQEDACGSNADQRPSVSVEVHGHDAVYWNQVASTLYNEAVELRKDAEKNMEAYRVLQNNHMRLGVAHRLTVDELAMANRELALLRVDSGGNAAGVNGSEAKIPLSVPVNTQGKDAVFWHQCARTLQQQFLDLNKKLEEKTALHVTVVENLKQLEVTCKEKDATIAGLECHVQKLLEQQSNLENQLRKLFK